MFHQVLNMPLVRLSLQSYYIGMLLQFWFFNLFSVFREDFVKIRIFIFHLKTLFSFVSVMDICRRNLSSINAAYIAIGRQFFQFLKVKRMSVPKTEKKSFVFHIGNEFPNMIRITYLKLVFMLKLFRFRIFILISVKNIWSFSFDSCATA